jgi:hypothetical protein
VVLLLRRGLLRLWLNAALGALPSLCRWLFWQELAAAVIVVMGLRW